MKKRSITLILVATKASSLATVTLLFMKAKIPFSGNAGKMNPGYLLLRICVRGGYIEKNGEVRVSSFDCL